MRRSGSSGAVERRLWKDHPRARRTVAAAAALSVAAAACWIAFALLLAVAIARVFVDGGTLASVDALLLAMLALAFVRGALLWSSDVVGQRAAGGIETDLRERLATALVALGPTAVRGSGSASSSTRPARGSMPSTRTSRATSPRASSPSWFRSWWRASSPCSTRGPC